MRSHPPPPGFSLVELLVVITIIVVLLALLTPALDKAIYQAGLAVCGAQQRTMGSGALRYALENKRAYFHRPGVLASDVSWRTWTLREPMPMDPLKDYDDRILLRPYIPLEALLDPLAGQVDISEIGTEDDVTILASYNLWFGFKFTKWEGMTRIGNRLRFRNESFNLLTGDLQFYQQAAHVSLSHPDREGTMNLTELQNWTTALGLYGRYTFTYWEKHTSMDHGLIDMNHGYQDGSVRRISALKAVPAAVIGNPANPGDYPLRMMGFIQKEEGNDVSPIFQVYAPADP